ncbi:TetR/AcrR family transcriptional regulator [Rhodococcus opacus]|nr:TetR/AcrR family transcriptional regulator [Rhodococcus opacus]
MTPSSPLGDPKLKSKDANVAFHGRPVRRTAGRPTDIDGEETRRQILDVAVVKFSQYGLKGTTLRDIAASADVTAGTIHHHFPTKEELYVSSFQYSIEQLYTGFHKIMREQPDLHSRLFLFLDHITDSTTRNDIRQRMVLRAWVDRAHIETELKIPPVVGETLHEIVSHAVQAGELRAEDTPVFLATFRSIVWGIAVLQLNTHTDARMAIDGLRLLVDGSLASWAKQP